MNDTRAGVFVELRLEETLQFDISSARVDSAKISITLLHKSGQKARLQIKADESVTIRRPASKQAVPA